MILRHSLLLIIHKLKQISIFIGAFTFSFFCTFVYFLLLIFKLAFSLVYGMVLAIVVAFLFVKFRIFKPYLLYLIGLLLILLLFFFYRSSERDLIAFINRSNCLAWHERWRELGAYYVAWVFLPFIRILKVWNHL